MFTQRILVKWFLHDLCFGFFLFVFCSPQVKGVKLKLHSLCILAGKCKSPYCGTNKGLSYYILISWQQKNSKIHLIVVLARTACTVLDGFREATGMKSSNHLSTWGGGATLRSMRVLTLDVKSLRKELRNSLKSIPTLIRKVVCSI